MRTNHCALSQWIKDEPLIDWVPPRAGSIAFLRYNLKFTSKDLCLRLIQDEGTFFVPGYCFEMKGFLRIGYDARLEFWRRACHDSKPSWWHALFRI